jgi:hypothetical protein
MQNSVLTQKEGVDLFCEKILERFDPGNLKEAWIKVFEKVRSEGERILLAEQGIRTERDVEKPRVRRFIRRISLEINLSYDEVLSDLRDFIKNNPPE